MARSWSLGGTSLPYPTEFDRNPVEISAEHTTVTGKTIRQVTKIKTEYTLVWKYLTQGQRATIWGLYTGSQPLSFSVTDGSLSVSAIDVIMRLNEEQFTARGSEFREDIAIYLIEVE